MRVDFDDIVYIEGMNEYLKVHRLSDLPLLVHTTFKQMNGHLPENFLQVHRSYVVNMKHVVEIERFVLLLEGGKHISVSEGNKDAFVDYLNRYTLKK